MYYYRVPVARTIIAGDLEKEGVQKPLELFADPWLKEWFDFWGHSRWGPVCARVNGVEFLWPTHRQDIARALRIKSPETRAIPRR